MSEKLKSKPTSAECTEFWGYEHSSLNVESLHLSQGMDGQRIVDVLALPLLERSTD